MLASSVGRKGKRMMSVSVYDLWQMGSECEVGEVGSQRD